MVRLACGVSGVPSNGGSPAFTQSGLLASVVGVACLLWAGCRDELLVDCDAGSYVVIKGVISQITIDITVSQPLLTGKWP